MPASGLVTVTLRAPVAAAAETETTTVSWVALFRVTETTVIPVPENVTVVSTNGQLAESKFTYKASPEFYRRGNGADPIKRLPAGLKTVPNLSPRVLKLWDLYADTLGR